VFIISFVYELHSHFINSLSKEGVPTLEEIAKLTLPPPPPPHPAHGNFKPYLKQRNKNINDKIYKAASYLLEPHMERILNMDNDNWDEKQNAIDELYEKVLEGIKSVPPKAFGVYAEEDDQMSVVLARLPDFAKRVEAAIEKYLKNVLQKEKDTCAGNEIQKNDPKPIFMDLLKAQNNNAVGEDGVPKLVYPLTNHKNHGPGRMVEEWQLAADIDTRRIMIREATRDVAAAMTEADSSRVYVKGPKGAGKTAVLASIVASARESGHIVLYLPDGNRLSRNGYYTEINEHRSQGRDTKIFDLPKVSQEICVELLASHEKDLKGLDASPELLEDVFTTEQLRTFLGLGKEETFDLTGQPLINLLQFGTENLALASGCYSAAVETLMNQTEKTFTVVMDEFNCYYEAGHYFSADYDIHVNHPIPMNQISLVQPFLDAFGAERKDDGTIVTKSSKPMKKGHILAGVTESRAIGRQETADLTNALVSAGCSTVHVPQYSPLEVKHILSNFEIIGIGRLRFDRGATVMNDQEVNYLRSVSGGYGQPLLDACLH
jgi:small subunit ribosomal protein S29